MWIRWRGGTSGFWSGLQAGVPMEHGDAREWVGKWADGAARGAAGAGDVSGCTYKAR